jgi:predicted NBD/HSP70 family sugar kinase
VEAPVRPAVDIGVDLGGTKIFGALVAPTGEVTDEIYVAHRGSAPPGEGFSAAERAAGPAYARLVETIEALARAARAAGVEVGGIGVGAPGITRPNGVVISAPAVGWRETPLGDLLAARFATRVRVDNDVNLVTLGEHAFGAGRGCDSLFLMAIGTGIGGGVVLHGRLWRGRHLAAGEIGALVPGRDLLSWSDTEWGALESLASGSGIAAQARAASAAAGLELPEEALRAERVFDEAAAGAPWAAELVGRTLDHWAVAISAVQAILDPDVVVLAGGVGSRAEGFIPDIEARLRRVMPFVPRLAVSALGYRAGVLGAAALLAE